MEVGKETNVGRGDETTTRLTDTGVGLADRSLSSELESAAELLTLSTVLVGLASAVGLASSAIVVDAVLGDGARVVDEAGLSDALFIVIIQ